jgi:hypothetical protein
MTLSYRIDGSSRIVFLEGDQPSLQEWQQTLLAIFSDPAFQRGFNFLSDRSRCKEPMTPDFPDAALQFLEAHGHEIGRCKWAFVVNTIAGYAMARVVQAIFEGTNVEFRVFKNIDEAYHWLLKGSHS